MNRFVFWSIYVGVVYEVDCCSCNYRRRFFFIELNNGSGVVYGICFGDIWDYRFYVCGELFCVFVCCVRCLVIIGYSIWDYSCEIYI